MQSGLELEIVLSTYWKAFLNKTKNEDLNLATWSTQWQNTKQLQAMSGYYEIFYTDWTENQRANPQEWIEHIIANTSNIKKSANAVSSQSLSNDKENDIKSSLKTLAGKMMNKNFNKPHGKFYMNHYWNTRTMDDYHKIYAATDAIATFKLWKQHLI